MRNKIVSSSKLDESITITLGEEQHAFRKGPQREGKGKHGRGRWKIGDQEVYRRCCWVAAGAWHCLAVPSIKSSLILHNDVNPMSGYPVEKQTHCQRGVAAASSST
jgi:hypothetical protein